MKRYCLTKDMGLLQRVAFLSPRERVELQYFAAAFECDEFFLFLCVLGVEQMGVVRELAKKRAKAWGRIGEFVCSALEMEETFLKNLAKSCKEALPLLA